MRDAPRSFLTIFAAVALLIPAAAVGVVLFGVLSTGSPVSPGEPGAVEDELAQYRDGRGAHYTVDEPDESAAVLQRFLSTPDPRTTKVWKPRVQAGQKGPDFILKTLNGRLWRLSGHTNEKRIVVLGVGNPYG